jgi:hypothetical protein
MAALTPELFHAITLAEHMRSDDPKKRPTAQEVERRARELRATMVGPSLREWARDVMPRLQRAMEDPLVGSVLTESFELAPELGGHTSSRLAPQGVGLPRLWERMPWWGKAALAIGLMLWSLSVGLLISLQLLTWLARPEAAVPSPPAPSVLGEAVREVAGLEEPGFIPAPPLRPLAPSVLAGQLAGTPALPAPTPAPHIHSVVRMDVSSEMPALVWVDDVKVGYTPLRGHLVKVGTHRIRLQASGKTVEATVLVGGRRGATQFQWDGGSALGAR